LLRKTHGKTFHHIQDTSLTTSQPKKRGEHPGVYSLRPDLLKPSILSGILVVVLFLLVYQAMQVIFPGAIEYWCLGCNPLGIKPSGVNLEELLWDFTWGLAGSTMVEVVTGEKLQKQST
jgi:hypothetical protein